MSATHVLAEIKGCTDNVVPCISGYGKMSFCDGCLRDGTRAVVDKDSLRVRPVHGQAVPGLWKEIE